jgi:hypothetical protein
MTGEPEQVDWAVEPVDPLILNALVELQDDDVTATADEHSRTLVGDAFDASVDAELQTEFDDVARTVRSEADAVHTEGEEVVEAVVADVRETLAEDSVFAALTHENVLSLTPTQAAVYTFSRNRDPAHLVGLDLSDSVMEHVEDAREHIGDENWAAGTEALDNAVAAARTIDEEVLTRTLAALCHHWNGDDQRAIDLVGEAVALNSDTWLPWLPGYSADADPAYATTDDFRAGKYGVSAFLRYIARIPERASVTPSVGYSTGGEVQWEPPEMDAVCSPVERLDEETHVRFQIEGPVDAFPAFQAYYIGLGIVDLETGEIRDVLKVLEDGPASDGVSETIRFERRSE